MPQATPWKSDRACSDGDRPVAPRDDDARHRRAVTPDDRGRIRIDGRGIGGRGIGNRGIGFGPADPPRLELPMADVDPVVDHRDPGAGARRRPGAVAPGDPRVGRRRVDLAKAPRVAVLGVALVRAGQRPKARGPGSGRRNPDGRGRIGIGGRGNASDHAGAATTDATGRKHRQGGHRGEPYRPHLHLSNPSRRVPPRRRHARQATRQPRASARPMRPPCPRDHGGAIVSGLHGPARDGTDRAPGRTGEIAASAQGGHRVSLAWAPVPRRVRFQGAGRLERRLSSGSTILAVSAGSSSIDP